MLRDTVKHPSVAPESALVSQRVSDVLDQNVVGVRKERPKANARVSRNRAIEVHIPGNHVKYGVHNSPSGRADWRRILRRRDKVAPRPIRSSLPGLPNYTPRSARLERLGLSP